MKRRCVIAAVIGALAISQPARAAVIVHDPAAYAKLIDEVRTAIDQLDALKAQLAEGKRLHDSLNVRSAIDAIAPDLARQELRRALPDLAALKQAANGNFEALGAIGQRARVIREARRNFDAGSEGVPTALEREGDLAARDLAVSEAAIQATSDRLSSLQTLQAAVGQAGSARAVADLQARISAEQALILNDQMRLQALALAHEAEARMQRQEELERIAAERRARMDFYRRGIR